ncbi:nucleoside triphosphate hydrolase [Nostoc sp. 3335mG]|nr:nucleoside triphosphate hydrolase [Nostoc sp. 3335mG]
MLARHALGWIDLGPLIAIVGSDGSGKSTVGQALLDWLKESGPAELCHLGKQSGNLGRALGRLPFVGSRVETTIDNKVKEAGEAKGPGFLASLAVYAFTLRRVRRFRRMLRLREQGVTILADRFPQLSMPAAIDGPGFGRLRSDRGIARRLAPIELRQFEWMTSHRPDLVIRLVVDLETALRRKPDHRRDNLAAKVADIPKLTFGGAPIVDIDAGLPIEQVVEQAKAAITRIVKR